MLGKHSEIIQSLQEITYQDTISLFKQLSAVVSVLASRIYDLQAEQKPARSKRFITRLKKTHKTILGDMSRLHKLIEKAKVESNMEDMHKLGSIFYESIFLYKSMIDESDKVLEDE